MDFDNSTVGALGTAQGNNHGLDIGAPSLIQEVLRRLAAAEPGEWLPSEAAVEWSDGSTTPAFGIRRATMAPPVDEGPPVVEAPVEPEPKPKPETAKAAREAVYPTAAEIDALVDDHKAEIADGEIPDDEEPEWDGGAYVPPPGGEGVGPSPGANGRAGSEEPRSARTPGSGPDYAAMTDEEMGIIGADTIKCRKPDWLWKHRVSRGGLTLLAGMGGLGKSQMTLWAAAAVSRGWRWPDGSGCAPEGFAMILSAEDDPSTTLVPRLRAMGADMSKIKILRAAVRLPRKDGGHEVAVMSLQDLRYWGDTFDRYPATRLLVIDPLPSYLGRGVNDNKGQEFRMVMEPFVDQVTRPRRIATVGVVHLNKATDTKSLINRISGSTSYGNLARNVHLVARSPNDPDLRAVGQIKCNDAPGDLSVIGFRVETREVLAPTEEGEELIETAVPVFEAGAVEIDLDEAVNAKQGARKPGPAANKTLEIAEALVDYLRRTFSEGGVWRPIKVVDIVEHIGGLGLLGTPKADGSYKSLTPLYRAADKVGGLPEPRTGLAVWTPTEIPKLKRDRRAHWQLVDQGSEAYQRWLAEQGGKPADE